jgi:predicted permease
MPLLPRLACLWRNLVHKNNVEQDIAEEVRAYLELLTETKIKEGADPAEARRAAFIEMGGMEQVKEKVREVKMGYQLETCWQDVRYAVRSLRKHALLSTVVIATLVLGFSISTGVFTYFTALWLSPRVDKDFDSFLQVNSAYTTDPTRPGRPWKTTLEDYLAFRDRAKSLRNLAAYGQADVPLGQDDPVGVRIALVTSNFFSVYGVEWPRMGRLLQPEDFTASNPVVVLSESVWRNRFASDPQIVGKVVRFNGQPVTVVGVVPTPAIINASGGAIAWFPYTLETYLNVGDNLLRPGEAEWLSVTGRLNPGFSRQDAATELSLIASQQDRLHPGRITTLTITDGSMIQDPFKRDQVIAGLTLVLGALTILVLIVCVNVATLLLARAAARRQEIAVRLALGASRVRLVRTLLVETYFLASLAGLLSIFFAYHITGALVRWLLPEDDGISLFSLATDWRVLGYLILVTFLAGTIAGVTPALQSLKVNLSDSLKGRHSSFDGAARGSRVYGLLVGAQAALSFFLLVYGCIGIRAYQNASTLNPGFESRQILWVDLFRRSRPTSQIDWADFYRRLTGRLAALPGVQSVAYAKRPPFMNHVNGNLVSSNYFTTLGIPIVSGRAIRDDDHPCSRGAKCSVVISQQLAREHWPGGNPLGQMIRSPDGISYEVVGVARDISSTRLGGVDNSMIYQPINLNKSASKNGIDPACPLVRFSGDEASLARAVSATIREMSPDLSVRAMTIQSLRDSGIAGLRRVVGIIIPLVAVALTLAVIGVYGVVAFAVTQRNKELGIRVALGARKEDIYRAILSSGMRPVAVGLLIGLVATLSTKSAVAHVLREGWFQEFTLYIHDPIIYAVTAILLAVAALAAMLIPARRATRVDPMIALRME